MEENYIWNLLKGDWKFIREITNYEKIYGKASFKEISLNQLLYKEEGKWFNEGKELNFMREYIYENKVNEILSYFVVTNFEKGKLFHKICLKQNNSILIAEDIHLCIRDLYKVYYEFYRENKNKFTITYDVKGPYKNFISKTTYERN
ncbi:MAG: hypothetical protein J0H68_08865 [Sphingobacteriia bacterium]|nr:hypothetical protein [Sphingobacteriia bacterium]